MQSLDFLLERYALEHDIRGTTVDYYRRVIRVFSAWLSKQSEQSFCACKVSAFLLDMQRAERSSYYRRSLRNGLVALLRFSGDVGRVRPVKLAELDPEAWFPFEVAMLIANCKGVPPDDDPTYWPTLIPAAYHTGLSQCDLERLTRADVAQDGVVKINRSRTGKRSRSWMPHELVDSRPLTGPLWPRTVSVESFRNRFARIVRASGLTGTFKKLRKTSGTEFDLLHPGEGHKHLANSRQIFEIHYNARRMESPPKRLPPLPDCQK